MAKLKRLKRLPGKEYKLPELKPLGAEGERILDLTSQMERELGTRLGDERLGKVVWRLQVKYPNGTVPELIVMAFLERKRARYRYQVDVLGGRRLRGGQVLDFAVEQGASMHVWEVNGRYWHTRGNKEALDEAQKQALLGQRVEGKPITRVLTIWDTVLDTQKRSVRERALALMMQGVEVGP